MSEVLNGLDMPGAVRDSKRFNYVYQLIKITVEEKLNLLSGNGQRTLFMIIKVMIIQGKYHFKKNLNLNLFIELNLSIEKQSEYKSCAKIADHA